MFYPDNVRIPPAFRANNLDAFSYSVCRIFIPTKRQGVTPGVELEDGMVRIWQKEDLLKIFVSKHNFTICEPGIFDSLLKWFKRDEIFGMDLGIPVWLNASTKLWYRGKSIKIGHERSGKYLWNLYDFFTFDGAPTDLDEIAAYVELLLGFLDKHKLGFSSLASPTAVSRHLLLETARQEFVCRDLEETIVEAFFQSAHGGRQESTGIGTLDCYSYDMNKAHLGILGKMPSIRSCQYRNNFPYTSEAVYGAYLITAEIPNMEMCPLPMEIDGLDMNSLAYPHGTIQGWYAKPYVDLLTEMNIPFTVHSSHQFLPFRDRDLPFGSLVRKLRTVMNDAPWYINGKAFYYGIAGSTISLRDGIDVKTGEIYKGAMPCFSPIIYSHILASQSVRVFHEIGKGTPVAIRSDAITTLGRTSTALKLEAKGPTTFITPLFKILPNGRGQEWEDRIQMFRDRPYLEIQREEFASIWQFLNRGKRLGYNYTVTIRIEPSHWQRDGEIPKMVGSLLDNWYPSTSRDAAFYANLA